MNSETELNSSVLGTFDYWKSAYDNELHQFNNINDPGEEWFGSAATQRMVRWVEKQPVPKDSAIIDLGCGNGLLLLALAECGYTNLVGIDYCANALLLAQEIFKQEGLDSNAVWLEVDITSQTVTYDKGNNQYKVVNNGEVVPDNVAKCTFTICLDKGTYDAISLYPDNACEKRRLYIKQLDGLLAKDGLFLITSCNWTGAELRSHFSNLTFVEELHAPTFSFGGRQGKTVTSCAFRKV